MAPEVSDSEVLTILSENQEKIQGHLEHLRDDVEPVPDFIEKIKVVLSPIDENNIEIKKQIRGLIKEVTKGMDAGSRAEAIGLWAKYLEVSPDIIKVSREEIEREVTQKVNEFMDSVPAAKIILGTEYDQKKEAIVAKIMALAKPEKNGYLLMPEIKEIKDIIDKEGGLIGKKGKGNAGLLGYKGKLMPATIEKQIKDEFEVGKDLFMGEYGVLLNTVKRENSLNITTKDLQDISGRESGAKEKVAAAKKAQSEITNNAEGSMLDNLPEEVRTFLVMILNILASFSDQFKGIAESVNDAVAQTEEEDESIDPAEKEAVKTSRISAIMEQGRGWKFTHGPINISLDGNEAKFEGVLEHLGLTPLGTIEKIVTQEGIIQSLMTHNLELLEIYTIFQVVEHDPNLITKTVDPSSGSVTLLFQGEPYIMKQEKDREDLSQAIEKYDAENDAFAMIPMQF